MLPGAARAWAEDVVAMRAAAEAEVAAAAGATEATSALAALAGTATAATAALRESTVALGATTAGEDAATASSERLAGAKTTAASATKALAAAQAAGAKTTHALAVAQGEMVGASTAVHEAQLRVSASAVAVRNAEAAVTKALAAQNIAVIDAASNQLGLAKAQLGTAESGLIAARSAENLARAQGQAARAGVATVAAMGGLRGAVLAASGPFIAATIATMAAAKAVKEASSLNEEINKTKVIFKDSAEAILEWSKTTAGSLGIAREQALQSANQFGNILVPMGVLPQKAAILSESLVRLAADMASFNNASPERVLIAMQAGLVGQSRPLRVLGVQLTAARVEQEAFRETGKKTASELTQQDKILARYSLILKDAAIQSGDFAATQDRLANSSRILKAQLIDLGGSLGTVLTPVLTSGVRTLNLITGALHQATAAMEEFGISLDDGTKKQNFFQHALSETIKVGLDAAFLFGTIGNFFGDSADKANLSAEDLTKRLQSLGGEARKVGGPGGVAALSIRLQDLIAILARGGPEGKRFQRALAEILADIQRTGKIPVNLGLVFQYTLLKQQIDAAMKHIADELNRAFGKGISQEVPVTLNFRAQAAVAEATGQGDAALMAVYQKALDEAERRLAGRQARAARLASRGVKTPGWLQDQIAQAAADVTYWKGQIKGIVDEQTRAKEQVASDAQTASDKADQAFIDKVGRREQGRLNQLAIAQQGNNLTRQIALTKALIGFYLREIKEVKNQVKNKQLRDQEVRRLQGELFQAREIDLPTLKAQRKQQQQEQATQILDIKIQIAEIRGQIGLERQLLELKKRRLIAQIKAAKGDRLLRAQLQLELAQTEQQLKDLRQQQNQNTQAAKALQQAEFAFLQTMTGFTANLIGNLIPMGATAGLVGGGSGLGISGTPTTPSNVRPANLPGQRGPGVPGVGAIPNIGPPRGTGTPTPATSGQSERQIDWLFKIWQELHKLNRSSDHPEAKHQRKVGAAIADTAGNTHGM